MSIRFNPFSVGVVLSILAFVSSCGSSEEERADALATELGVWLVDSPNLPFPIEAEESNCIAEGIVDGYGLETLETAGVTVEDVSSFDPTKLEPANVTGDSFDACLDLKARFAAEMSFGDPEIEKCLLEGLDIEDLKIIFSSNEPTNPAGERLISVLGECSGI